MDTRVLNLKTAKECDVFRANAIALGNLALAAEARLRKIDIKAESYATQSIVEHECIKALYAYEELLTEKRGRTQPASRTWPMISKYGVIGMVEKVVNRKADAVGYTTLVDMGLKEYAFEAVVLRYPEAFSAKTIERSRERMGEVNLSESDSTVESAWSDEELLAAVEAYVDMQGKERNGISFSKASYYQSMSLRFNRSAKAFEYRMQNISYVLSLMGRSWLTGLKPAKNVGKNNAIKIESYLNELEGILTLPVVEFEISTLEALQSHSTKPPIGNTTSTSVSYTVTQFVRNSAVRAWVLKRANGICECCNKDAPFVSASGQPFLEVHHVRRMADNGADTVSNAVAICPNCHRELHYGMNAKELIDRLYDSIEGLARI